MSELSLTLADLPDVAETLSESSVGDEVTAQVSLKLNSLDADIAVFDVQEVTLDNVVESELNETGEDIAPEPPEDNAVNSVFGGLV